MALQIRHADGFGNSRKTSRAIVPTLHLTPDWKATQKKTFETRQIQLGDGYQQIAGVGTIPPEEWDISISGLSTQEVNALVAQFSQWGGVTESFWHPVPDYEWLDPNENDPYYGSHLSFPEKEFYCKTWSRSPQGPDLWMFRATLFARDLMEGS
jgi:phage-related protein